MPGPGVAQPVGASTRISPRWVLCSSSRSRLSVGGGLRVRRAASLGLGAVSSSPARTCVRFLCGGGMWSVWGFPSASLAGVAPLNRPDDARRVKVGMAAQSGVQCGFLTCLHLHLWGRPCAPHGPPTVGLSRNPQVGTHPAPRL